MAHGIARLSAPPTGESIAEAAKDGIDPATLDGALNAKQRAYLGLSQEVQVFLGGFGAGKTFIGAWKSAQFMLDNPGCLGLALSPIFTQTRNQFNALLALFERMHARDGVNLIESAALSNGRGQIRLTNGSALELRSAGSKVGLFGLNVAFVWIDEVELCDDPAQVYSDAYSRLRQQSNGTTIQVRRHNVFLTSTAHYLTGLLADLVKQAKRERAAYEEAAAAGRKLPAVQVGVVTAPSTCAIGYGLTKDRIDAWARTMDPDTFGRAVLCRLVSPPEIVFADRLSGERYPEGNRIDYQFDPAMRTYVLVDWGVRRPHVLFCQMSTSLRALVVLAEWGPEGSSVQDTVRTMRDWLLAHGLVDERGRYRGGKRFIVIGDPTTNPGARPGSTEGHMMALDGRATIAGMGWDYVAPERPEQRAKQRQIQFGRAMLRPRMDLPRVLFASKLFADKDLENKDKRTKRGIIWALSEGYRYQKNALGDVTDSPKKDGLSDHAVDALLYGLVIVFANDFWHLYNTEDGLPTGAANW